MSIILKTFCYFILQITLLVSFLFLLRGHNHPGGGFIGALVACTGIGFYVLSYKKLPQFIAKKYVLLIFSGTLCLIFSLVIPLSVHKNLLTGLWWQTNFLGQVVKLGTPLLFDVGVYLAILGSLLWIVISLESDFYD